LSHHQLQTTVIMTVVVSDELC